MSLILKGINLPPKEKTINIDINGNGDVWVSTNGEWIYHKNSANEISQPHGRLVDADHIIKRATDYNNDHWNYYYCQDLSDFIDYIEKEPTVIEAEEKE